jgi:cadmium resistance protein CadD (predicted permease)
LATGGLGADIGVAAAAFFGTNIDNGLVTMAMVAAAPLERARRIAAGQVAGAAVIVAVAAAAAALLYEFSAAVVGLLGLVPLAIGVRGLVGLRGSGAEAEATPGADDGRRGRIARRAVGRSFTAAALVTISASGDNLAAYIPLFRVGGTARLGVIAVVFIVGEFVLTVLVLTGGRHQRARGFMTRGGAVVVPILLCCIGILVLLESGTFGLL